ncbi:MAG TPA: outer membrane protein assembly factor BamE [Gallionella sp.]|nr:outer membrane protein assembly factor BamE [Gallionella sp.]
MRTKLILCSLLLSGCSYVSTPLLAPYQMDIRQGNFVTPEMREKLKLGMTRQQVMYVLGTPLIHDAFHTNRWDYVYYLKHYGQIGEEQRLTLYFEGDTLARIDDSKMPPLPASAAASAEPVAAKPAEAPAVATAPVAAAAVATEPLPEAPKPQPVAKPDPAAEVVKALQAWAEAWSSRNIDGYLAAYKPDFAPAGMSRKAWEKQRRDRIGKSQKIELGLGNLNIRMHDATHATVKFIQNYRSASYQDNIRKTLTLEKVGNAWLIAGEETEKK